MDKTIIEIILLTLFVTLMAVWIGLNFLKKQKIRSEKAENKYFARIRNEFIMTVHEDSKKLEISSQRQRWSGRSLLLYIFPVLILIAAFYSRQPGWALFAVVVTLLIGFMNHASFTLHLNRSEKTAQAKWRWCGIPYGKTLKTEQLNGLHFGLVNIFVNGFYQRTDTRIYNAASGEKAISGTLSFRADPEFILQCNQKIREFLNPGN